MTESYLFQSGHTASNSAPAFLRSYESLLAEERRLREMAEERARAYLQALTEAARLIDAAEIDRRQRADPLFLQRMEPGDWRSLFVELVGRRAATALRWDGRPGAGTAPVNDEVLRLQDEVSRLAERLREAQQDSPYDGRTGGAAQPGDFGEAGRRPATAQLAGVSLPASLPGQSSQPKQPKCRPEVALPELPLRAPNRYADLFRRPEDWQRRALPLAILGVTGWSFRLAIAEAVGAILTPRSSNGKTVSGTSGAWKNVYDDLASDGLWAQEVVELRDGLAVHIPVVNLTDLGYQLLRSVGIQPVISEWERLVARPKGRADLRQAALVVACAYHARQRGWMTEVRPEAVATWEPDLSLKRDDTRVYCEVTTGPPVELILSRWRNQAITEEQVALCTTTAENRSLLVQEARPLFARGMATDLATLIASTNARDFAGFWAETWP